MNRPEAYKVWGDLRDVLFDLVSLLLFVYDFSLIFFSHLVELSWIILTPLLEFNWFFLRMKYFNWFLIVLIKSPYMSFYIVHLLWHWHFISVWKHVQVIRCQLASSRWVPGNAPDCPLLCHTICCYGSQITGLDRC